MSSLLFDEKTQRACKCAGAGSITAAQFLQRFVKEGTPWVHLDIAGVASVKSATDYAPKGATGWGVAALNRLVSDMLEKG